MSEYKCLTCEFYTHSKAQMMEHQLVKHQRFFNPDDNKPTMISQLGHKLRHVKVLNHGDLVWETVTADIDPNEKKLPTGNLQEHSLMPFGKHKGKRLDEVPIEYLNWLYCNTEKRPFNTGVFTYIRKNLKKLKFENLDLVWEPK